jgi:type IV pilus assembly protein PilQ
MDKIIAMFAQRKPQVVIEARLVEAARSWSRGLGIQWGGRNDQVGQIDPRNTHYWGLGGRTGGDLEGGATGLDVPGNNLPSEYLVSVPGTGAAAGLAQLGMQFGLLATNYITELDASINAGEATGETKLIARPKVQVIDGASANITDGDQIPYETVGLSGTQTQLITAALSLTVTPRVSRDGVVAMQINVTNDEPDVFNGQTTISTKSLNTELLVKEGETAVIGGILSHETSNNRTGFPNLMNLPVLNFLFTHRSQDRSTDELLIFISPTIMKRPPLAP